MVQRPGGPSVNAVSLSFAHNIDRQMERQTETHAVHTPTYTYAPIHRQHFHTGERGVTV